MYVGSVVLTRYSGQSAADVFFKRLNTLGIRCYRHYPIAVSYTHLDVYKRQMRRFAESSSVRSSHWTEAVMGAFTASAIR